jgi:hypothetical protein
MEASERHLWEPPASGSRQRLPSSPNTGNERFSAFSFISLLCSGDSVKEIPALLQKAYL